MKPVKIESYSQLFFWRKWLQSLGQSAKNVHIGLQIFQHDTCRRPTQLARSVLTGIKSLRSDQSAMEIGPINNEDRNNKQCRPDQSSIMVKTSLKKDEVVKDENLAWALAETALSACFKVVLDLAMIWFLNCNILISCNVLILTSFQVCRLFLGLLGIIWLHYESFLWEKG